MLTHPNISVIVPTLQEEQLLERTLRQFTAEVRRTFQLELIVSDGGSTDKTLPVACQYADVVVEHTGSYKQNIAQGRNAGARAARGALLVFINADTMIEQIDTFFLRITKEALRKEVSGVTCAVCVHEQEERTSDVFFHTIFNWYFWFLNIIGIGMGRGECQIIRHELFWNIGGYNERIVAGEDFDLFVRLKRRGKISFLHELKVRESPRRYRKYGYVYITCVWFLNAVFVLLFGRSLATEWKPIR